MIKSRPPFLRPVAKFPDIRIPGLERFNNKPKKIEDKIEDLRNRLREQEESEDKTSSTAVPTTTTTTEQKVV